MLERRKSEYHDYCVREQQIKRQELAAKEKNARFQEQLESKAQSLDERVRQAEREILNFGEESKQSKMQLDQLDHEIQLIRSRMQQLKISHETEITALQDSFTHLQQNAHDYVERLRQEMSSVYWMCIYVIMVEDF